MNKRCVICGGEFDARMNAKTCGDKCRKEKKRAYEQEYRQTPEGKAYHKAYEQERRQRPERQAYEQERRQRPEYKAYQREYSQRPERRAYQREYKAKERATAQFFNTLAMAGAVTQETAKAS